mmetsp:Transcript_43987/g.125955  ORF Transcript_43987/g.125955 Transcript_43987/m.125955 type:complete len:297 (-) Transcript_43987:19-909(-)
MALLTCIARASDGLILAEAPGSALRDADRIWLQAQQLLRNLYSMPQSHSVEASANVALHFRVVGCICYLVALDSGYEADAAFRFLDDVGALFQEELKRAFGTRSVDYGSHIELLERPHAFVAVCPQIARAEAHLRDAPVRAFLGASQMDMSSEVLNHFIDFLHCPDASLDVPSCKGRGFDAFCVSVLRALRVLAFQFLIFLPMLVAFIVGMPLLLALVYSTALEHAPALTLSAHVLALVCIAGCCCNLFGRVRGLFSRARGKWQTSSARFHVVQRPLRHFLPVAWRKVTSDRDSVV